LCNIVYNCSCVVTIGRYVPTTDVVAGGILESLHDLFLSMCLETNDILELPVRKRQLGYLSWLWHTLVMSTVFMTAGLHSNCNVIIVFVVDVSLYKDTSINKNKIKMKLASWLSSFVNVPACVGSTNTYMYMYMYS